MICLFQGSAPTMAPTFHAQLGVSAEHIGMQQAHGGRRNPVPLVVCVHAMQF